MIATLSKTNRQPEVDVFKTTVKTEEDAAEIINLLKEYFPHHLISFDLEDCDKILRIEGVDNNQTFIKNTLLQEGFICEVLV